VAVQESETPNGKWLKHWERIYTLNNNNNNKICTLYI